MTNQVVVITGASAGIGAALARRIGSSGGRPVLAARREPELRAAAAEAGPRAVYVVADMTRRAEVEHIRDVALERCGGIDVWVNNAGRGITRPVSQITDDDLDEMMRVNVKSALYGMQTALAHFRERGRGHIINVSSMLGRVPYVGVRAAYSAAKHALDALTANLRMELASSLPGVAVTNVIPGVVATDFGLNALHGGFDSRSLPNAQPVDEVAEVIANVIERPRAEVYTRPEYHDLVRRYFGASDLTEIESQPPFTRPKP